MIVGVPKEIKEYENRVAITPEGAAALVERGHHVIIETGAGDGSGFPDDVYKSVGAEVVDTAEEVFQRAELILKVKEPQPSEYRFLRPHQILFAYLHLAANRDLTLALIERKVTAIAYETVQAPDGTLPLLAPMSEIAGRMAPQIAAHYLERPQGGRGILLGGVPGVPPADVVILGGGVVGTNAARVALGLGARVTVFDVNPARLRFLDDTFGGMVTTLMSNSFNIARAVQRADVLIGAVLVPGARAPRLVTEDMVRAMKRGSVVIDVAVDQGGSIVTCDRVTTHADPVYIRHGVLHYAVSNIPGAVPHTATVALVNATLPYVLKLADAGFEGAVQDDPALAAGVNTCAGFITHPAVAGAHEVGYTPLDQILETTEQKPSISPTR